MKKLLSIIIVSSLLLAGCADGEIQNENMVDLMNKCKPLMDQAAETVNKACNDKLASQATLQSDFDLKQKCVALKSSLPEFYKINNNPQQPDYVFSSLRYSKKLKTCVASYLVLAKVFVGSIEDSYTLYFDAINNKILFTSYDRTKKDQELSSDEIIKLNKIIEENYEKEIELLE